MSKKRRIHHHAANKIRRLFAKKQPDTSEADAATEQITGERQTETPPPPVDPASNSGHGGDSGDYRAHEQEKAHPNPYEREQLRLTRSLTRATIAIAVATVVYMVFSGYQSYKLRQSVEIGREQIRTAQTQTNLSERSLNFAVNSAAEQSNVTSRTLEFTGKSVNAAQTQANASMSQAGTSRIAADAAKESTLIAKESMRPVVSTAVDPADIRPTEMRIRVQVRNDGGTKTNVVLKYCFLTSASPNPSHSLKDCDSGRVGHLGPSVIVGHTIKDFYVTIKDDDQDQFVSLVRQRKLYLFLVTVAEYDDFGRRGEFPLCGVWREDYGRFGECTDLTTPGNQNPK